MLLRKSERTDEVRRNRLGLLGALSVVLPIAVAIAAALALVVAGVKTAHLRVARDPAHKASLRLQEGWTLHYLRRVQTECSRGVQSIAVDPQDRVWVVTDCGVHVFDGRQWTLYDHPAAGLAKLAIDLNGRVWIRGGNDSISVFDGRTWRNLPMEGETPVPGQKGLVAFAVDNRGRVWVGARADDRASVSVFDGVTWKTYTSRNSGLVPGSLIISTIAFDRLNRAWIAVYQGGVSVFDGQSWVTHADKDLGLPYVTAIAFDKKGNTWVATESGGLLSYDGNRWNVYIRDTSNPHSSQPGREIGYIAFDKQGRVWINDPLRVFDGRSWTTLTPDNSGLEGEPLAIAADHEGRIWVVTDKAVNVIPSDWKP